MTYSARQFRRADLKKIVEVGDAEGGQFFPDLGTQMALEQMPNVWTILWNDEPLLCGGTVEQWPGRHIAFAFLNKTTGRHMIFTTKAAIQIVNNVQGRVEFTVRRDFAKGHRWARLIGFHVEECPDLMVERLPVSTRVPGQMKAFGPEGEDHVAYVRFNGG